MVMQPRPMAETPPDRCFPECACALAVLLRVMGRALSVPGAPDAEADEQGGEEQGARDGEAELHPGDEARSVGDQGAEDRDRDGTADLPEGVEHGTGGACLSRRHTAEHEPGGRWH